MGPLRCAWRLPLLLLVVFGGCLFGIFLLPRGPKPGTAGAALLRSGMSSEWSARLLRELLVTQILRRVIRQLDIDPAEAPMRSSLIASQMAGLAVMRYLIKLEPLASASPEELVATIGPTIQRYTTGPLP